jgi:CRP-like cAMP-binding protein
MAVTKKMNNLRFNARTFLAESGAGRTLMVHRPDEVIFSQGDRADSIFYVKEGRIKLSVVSKQGKIAVIAILSAGEFFGEGCVGGQVKRMSTAVALSDCVVVELDKAVLLQLLQEKPAFSELFLRHLVSRNIRVEEDLADQLSNASERRLARMLLLLSNFGKEGKAEPAIGKISQQTLAEMVGTTRSRVSFFMNKFRKLGFIDYKGQLEVRNSLRNFVLYE